MKKNPIDYLALALDNLDDENRISWLIEQTKIYCGVYKIGLELFTRFGPSIVVNVQKAQRKIFLDLKFHDIPNTVAQAVYSASRLGVHYCTLHSQGGFAMMSAAAAAAGRARESGLTPPKLIGVTVLTSIDARCLREDLNVELPLADHIVHLAQRAIAAGLDGIVCSAADVSHFKQKVSVTPENFEIVTPGIRRRGSAVNDQKRTATPAEAIDFGATLLVIGREVTMAADPQGALKEILSDIS
jgi:orotidine-5'-phosphate decarboxylase